MVKFVSVSMILLGFLLFFWCLGRRWPTKEPFNLLQYSVVSPEEDVPDHLLGAYVLSKKYLPEPVLLTLLSNVLYQKLGMSEEVNGRILRYTLNSIHLKKEDLFVKATVTLVRGDGWATHADAWQLEFRTPHDQPLEPTEVLRADILSPPIPVDQLLPFAPSSAEDYRGHPAPAFTQS